MANLSLSYLTEENAYNFVLVNGILSFICGQYFKGKATAVAHGDNQPALLDAVLNGMIVPVVISSRNDDVLASSATVHLIALGGAVWQPAWRPRERMLVVTDRNDSDHVRDWLSALWNTARFTDIVVMVIGHNSVQFFTFFPFAINGTCGQTIVPQAIHVENLFPIKFNGNLNQCGIRALSDWIMPYVRKEETEALGVEDRIFLELLARLNGTRVNMTLDLNERVWLLTNRDGELIGAGKMMKMHQADVMFAGLTYRADMVGVIEMLLPHSMDSLAWFVPPPQPLPGPLKLYLAFTSHVWFLVIAVFATTTLTLSIFSYTLLTDITALTLNLPASSSVPHSLLIFCYIYSLHITSTYQASLFMLFSRTVMEKPIETLEEAAEADLLGRFFHHHRPLMNLTDHTLWQKIYKRHVFADRQNPAIFATTRDFLLLVQLNPVTFYIQSLRIYDDFGPALLPLKQRFLMNPVMFYVSKGNPIGHFVNNIIQHLVDGGIVRHWLDNFIGQIVIRQHTLNSENMTLHFSHLSGAFALLGGGLFAAFLIFLIENIFHRAEFRRKGIFCYKPQRKLGAVRRIGVFRFKSSQ